MKMEQEFKTMAERMRMAFNLHGFSWSACYGSLFKLLECWSVITYFGTLGLLL